MGEKKLTGESLNVKPMEAALLVPRFRACLSFTSCSLFCAAFSRYCSAFAATIVGFSVCDISSCVCSVLMFYFPCSFSLSLSFAASMVDTMLPLLNWTFHFISVGRSKGIDHFIFIIININLPSEIFMYPRGTVDSDEYSPDNNLVLLITSKKINKKPMLSFSFSALHVLWLGVLPSWSTSP